VVRLAFALVTALEPDVLIVDEALAVGDQQFQKKCIARIDAFRKNGCTILFCSHSLYHVRQLCNRVLWLENGQQKAFGETETVLSQYEADIRAKEALATATAPAPPHDVKATHPEVQSLPPSGAKLISVEVEKLGAGNPPVLESPDLVICITAQAPLNETPQFGVMLEQVHGVGVTSAGTHYDSVAPTHMGNGLWTVKLRFPKLQLFSGQYTLSAYLFDSQGLVVYEEWLHCIQFHHIFPGSTPGIVRLEHVWE
jgi:lipopolysaccharide transport system ATP-binding protein